jgi:hypothetical protein
MTTHAWPAERVFVPSIFDAGVIDRTAMSESAYSGAIATGEVPFAYRRTLTVGWPAHPDYAVQQRRVGFLSKIRRAHRVLIPRFPQMEPAGTLRGSPTVTSTTAQGAVSIPVTTSVAGQTVLMGDELGLVTAIGTQVVTVTADATASGTALTVAFEPPLRASVAAGSAVTWNAPTPLFMLAGQEWSATFRAGEAETLAVDFVEVW